MIKVLLTYLVLLSCQHFIYMSLKYKYDINRGNKKMRFNNMI